MHRSVHGNDEDMRRSGGIVSRRGMLGYALHGVEMPFVFNRSRYGVAWDGKDSDALRAAADPRGDRFRVGREMYRAWTNFARSGNPSTAELPWPEYDVTARKTMIFDAKSEVVEDPRSSVRPAVQAL